MITTIKNTLDKLQAQYETKDFIKEDPIQFPHGFKNTDDKEIAAFLSAIFAYGKRELFIKKLHELFSIMHQEPKNYILDFDAKKNELKGFNYRFAKDIDLIEVLSILKILYSENSSLKELFSYSYNEDKNVISMLEKVTDYFYARIKTPVGAGFYHLLANPKNKGACKRYHMFLRWMVRNGEVDLGLWDFIPRSELFIPLDVHVSRISRELNLLNRNSNDLKAVTELTSNLKLYDPLDPVKYDFALFGYGINR